MENIRPCITNLKTECKEKTIPHPLEEELKNLEMSSETQTETEMSACTVYYPIRGIRGMTFTKELKVIITDALK